MVQKEKRIKSNLKYKGKVMDLYCDDVQCYNGNISQREIVTHNGGVCILALVDNKVIMERQYRYAFDEILYELPAGKIEKGEDTKLAALREFEEETGYKAHKLIDFGKIYPTCGYSNEIIYLYVAEELEKTHRHLDADESIDIEYISLEKIEKMIYNGQIVDGKTVCLLMKYLLKKRQ